MSAPSARKPNRSTGNAKLEAAVRHVMDGTDLQVWKVGNLRLPKSSGEARRCSEIRGILKDYLNRKVVERPLSIAVFGQPGSGKSFCVKEILRSLGKEPDAKFNLSQESDHLSLAAGLHSKLPDRKGKLDSASVFFFDEFDAPLGGDPLGWLRWFLAPMQDGEFLFQGKVAEIGKSIFIFAGGTAPSLDEFDKRAKAELNQADYRAKKVPDFISRLHGFIDIQGINSLDGDRPLRRALVLRRRLLERWPDKQRPGSSKFPIDKGLVEQLLSNVHFVHGVRSMGAILDMSRFGKEPILKAEHLPHNDLRKLHLSRGWLDAKRIGISAGLNDHAAANLLTNLTTTLLQNGANLAYGGNFTPEGTLQAIIEASQDVPKALVSPGVKRIRNYLGFPGHLNPKPAPEKLRDEVDCVELMTLSESELRDLGVTREQWFKARPENLKEKYNPKHHLAWAISLFRMRVRLIQDIDALVVVGGKDGESWGRFSGVAEEVMLAIALGKPVYVLGGLVRKNEPGGGAAEAVGRLLGLGDTLVNPEACLNDVSTIPMADTGERFGKCFSIPGYPNLPCTISELRTYLFDHSIPTGTLPWNGLSPEENRELYSIPIKGQSWKRCVNLIIEGLRRLNWKTPF